MTLPDFEWVFYVKFFTITKQCFQNLFYILTIELVYITSAEADCDPENILDPRKNCGSFVDATSSEP